jgi:hypothetical protein
MEVIHQFHSPVALPSENEPRGPDFEPMRRTLKAAADNIHVLEGCVH